jgi:hypothetical protein
VGASVPEELNKRVEALAAEVRGLREGLVVVAAELGEANDRAEDAHATARRTRSWLWVVGSVLGTALLVGGLALGGAFYLIQVNNHRFCDVVAATIDPSNPPPTTARGKAQIENFRKLGRSLGCPDPPLTGQ